MVLFNHNNLDITFLPIINYDRDVVAEIEDNVKIILGKPEFIYNEYYLEYMV